VVVGWDCASPWLALERWAEELPNLARLRQGGAWGRLRSCDPPITVPAWMAMGSGADPGALGVYGFRNRVRGGGAEAARLTSREDFEVAPLWERLGSQGLRACAVGVPGTWPPRPMLGKLIPGPETPPEAPKTWPPELWGRVKALAPGYAFDVGEHRKVERGELVRRVRAMTEARFKIVEDLAQDDDWNLLWVVEIGLDRLHHALWACVDPSHPRYEGPGSPWEEALLDYYKLLDARLGRLWGLVDDGQTACLVVSDHGARPFVGGFRLNAWLIQEGLLVLKDDGAQEGRWDGARIDWSRTRAWAMAGYCGRVFLNLEGRDPGGIVAAHEAGPLLTRVQADLEALRGPSGEPWRTRALRSEALYEVARGFAPDLTVYVDDLSWRCLDTLGGEGLYRAENDTGPDTANHDWDGILVAGGAGVSPCELRGARLVEVAGHIEALLGLSQARRG
jgi:predicted AlkP superfamily phosphohydrolase/phosphomutase